MALRLMPAFALVILSCLLSILGSFHKVPPAYAGPCMYAAIQKERVTDESTNDSSLRNDTAVSSSTNWSPLAQRPFDYILQHAWAKDNNCRTLAEWLRQTSSELANNTTSHFVHTELLATRDKDVDPRKEQLPVLSFLATQHPSLVLNILVTNRSRIEPPPDWLGTLLAHEQYGKRIRLEYLQSALREAEGFLSESEADVISRGLGPDGVQKLGSRSDISRYLLLFMHGGLWFDTDTIFLSDVRPLMGADFVSITESRFYNGAVIGTSAKHSEFMKRALERCASKLQRNLHSSRYFRYGPSLFKDMRNDLSEPMPFKALPGCLVDTGWVGGFKGDPHWDKLFSANASRSNLKFLKDENGPFSFHWHGRWNASIVKGSSASIAHSNFVRRLQLDPTTFGAVKELNLDEWEPEEISK
eukprot:CAMPEP_0197466654 /NCGR_PEP_ID=MMETSP1175-20131217/65165_1 /TAXON_ID=1003142 /ORGANISM="Triceratium dubium, Strain CCMP147" /LENGTH=414 /DNA_ID=CAMNT_0043002703 /DNA_START=55 /DNA_END=1299 /DNA_ORIENTATION=-